MIREASPRPSRFEGAFFPVSGADFTLLGEPIWIMHAASAVELATAVALGDFVPQVRQTNLAAEPLDQGRFVVLPFAPARLAGEADNVERVFGKR